MVTGASTADVALVLIDARKGLLEQSRRHAYLAALLGIRHLVACVNKMDLVGFEEARFREIEGAFASSARSSGSPTSRAVPISALRGRQRRRPSRALDWYRRRRCSSSSRRSRSTATATSTTSASPSSGRSATATTAATRVGVAGGVLATGDEVVVLPSGSRSRIARSTRREGRSSGRSRRWWRRCVLEDELDVGRGDSRRAWDAPEVARELDATVCWMVEAPAAGRRPLPAQAHDAAGAGERSRRSPRWWTSTPSRSVRRASSASTTSGA